MRKLTVDFNDKKRVSGCKSKKAASGFLWHTHDGRDLAPSDMTTSHLFNTLLMVWNHSAPEEFKFRPFKQWSLFNGFYHKEYIKEAMRVMSEELTTRQLNNFQARTLQQMAERFNSPEYKEALKNESN